MLDYRVYSLEPDGHIYRPPQIIACADDADAEEQSLAAFGRKRNRSMGTTAPGRCPYAR